MVDQVNGHPSLRVNDGMKRVLLDEGKCFICPGTKGLPVLVWFKSNQYRAGGKRYYGLRIDRPGTCLLCTKMAINTNGSVHCITARTQRPNV